MGAQPANKLKNLQQKLNPVLWLQSCVARCGHNWNERAFWPKRALAGEATTHASGRPN